MSKSSKTPGAILGPGLIIISTISLLFLYGVIEEGMFEKIVWTIIFGGLGILGVILAVAFFCEGRGDK